MSVTEIATARTSSVGDEVGIARQAFRDGRTRSFAWRQAQLQGLLRFIDECEGDIVTAIESDLGRGAMASFMADVGPVRHEIRHTLAKLNTWMQPTSVPISAATAPGKAFTVPEPRGVVLVLGTWNFPLLLTLQPLVSALAAGNTAVVKPSDLADATGRVLAEKLPRYIDGDAVRVVLGDGMTNRELLTHRFDHTFFTGSTKVGKAVMEASAKYLTPVTLELGGKSPVIVAADADIEVAARRIAWAKSINAGQTCIAPDYVLVEESVRPRLVSRLLEELPAQAAADTTHIVNRHHLDRLAGLLQTNGGETFGGAVDESALSIAPALVTDPDLDSELMTEEIFGPILPLISVPSIADAVEFINERPKPLALYLFTESRGVEETVIGQTSSGVVGVNHLLYQLLVPELPFGGVGDSGLGRYHGKHGFDTFSHHKAVLRKPTRPDVSVAYPPYGSAMRRVLRKLMG
ncbi:aldehyde dehydrogenase family protein [Gordonia sp. HY002]|uniref:aldehyde dehydrogenase family protein n=1 Tax=Gordonia zhenghanii TaxID=2911516 RepID=UPI001EEF80A5|nr:aldehyde dehydrogenase family protein [Gordonia zhenghanii]MCF8571338.1 aldehyde dehydrogenase family protein [Gordonia zhenghanii]MCF8601862.1 aldehyde dehydrogenase family protein [Gordonia zhenghanii]